MKPIIFFKFLDGQPANAFKTPIGYLAIGNNSVADDGTILISSECRTMDELRAQADHLKRLIERAVIDAEMHLPDR